MRGRLVFIAAFYVVMLACLARAVWAPVTINHQDGAERITFTGQAGQPTNNATRSIYYNTTLSAFQFLDPIAGNGSFTSTFANTTASTTVTNTTVETPFGSELPAYANQLTVGTFIVMKAQGTYQTNATDQLAFRIYYGGVGGQRVFTTSSISPATGAPNNGWAVDIIIAIRAIGASGIAQGSGFVAYQNNDGPPSSTFQTGNVNSAINTALSRSFQAFILWSAANANNRISVDNQYWMIVRN